MTDEVGGEAREDLEERLEKAEEKLERHEEVLRLFIEREREGKKASDFVSLVMGVAVVFGGIGSLMITMDWPFLFGSFASVILIIIGALLIIESLFGIRNEYDE